MFQQPQQKYLHPHHNSHPTPSSPKSHHHASYPNKHHPNKNKTPKSTSQQHPPSLSINFNKIKQMEFLQNITSDFPETPIITSTAPQFSETNQNVGIIFWYSPPTIESNSETQTTTESETPTEIQILAGVETCYLTDKLVPEVKAIIEKYQIYTYSPYDPNHNHITINHTPHEVFSKRAKLLSKELNMPIYFDKPKPIHSPYIHTHNNQTHNPHTQWQVQYRVINETLKLGILKGSMEESETKEEAIQREIQEELFPFNTQIPLNQQKITHLPNTIYLNKDSLYTFHYQLNEKEKAAIEKNIQILQNQNYGELVNYEFRPLNDFFPITSFITQPNFFQKTTKTTKTTKSTKNTKQTFNGKSRLYLKEFYDYLYNQNIKNNQNITKKCLKF